MDSDHAQWSYDGSGSRSPLVVSFSGIDGAGKTTQIESLTAWLTDAGLRVRLIRFWEDVVVLRRLRETTSHILFKGEQGVGAPGRPVRRRDKNVRSWYLLPVRMALCFFDLLRLALVTAQIRQKRDADVIVFDRYLYDQLANIRVSNRRVQAYLRLLIRLMPCPDIAYLLDADPVLARARKPEYPLAFLRRHRACYLAVSRIAGMDVVPDGAPEEVGHSVRDKLARKLGRIQDRPTPPVLTRTY